MQADSGPPDTSDVDPHRVEDLVNRFIAAKQDALFLAPDAYYRATAADAVDGAPDILDRLNGLKQATLDAAPDDGARFVPARSSTPISTMPATASTGMSWPNTTSSIAKPSPSAGLIQRAAAFEHNNDDKLAGLAEAHASAAQKLARMNGEPAAPAMDAARSAIWRTAIDQRLSARGRSTCSIR